jgi:hypothetical protein
MSTTPSSSLTSLAPAMAVPASQVESTPAPLDIDALLQQRLPHAQVGRAACARMPWATAGPRPSSARTVLGVRLTSAPTRA